MTADPIRATTQHTIVQRLRNPDGSIPLIVSYDVREKIWNPPMPVLFQRGIGNERRAYTPTAIRKVLINALAATRLTDPNGDPLIFSPHDLRRIFVTDAIMNGLPPHIAQVICGHKSIDTTMGYKAVYPVETIEAHWAFIARRRSVRPGEEYRTPTDEEWDAFLSHFEKRKVSVATCARAFSTPYIHEHACVRCSLLRPEPAQRARLEEIRDNFEARIIDAKREGWLDEVEGLQVSYSGVNDKLAQIETSLQRTTAKTGLGMPTFGSISGRTSAPGELRS
ncbi:site-specific integrase [Nocardia sp. NPDC051990]|uniref:site-specific integrase n=1 Tax=Nocardia sp. NPDC051990 TaxID=3155285 RepID=UPI00341F8929